MDRFNELMYYVWHVQNLYEACLGYYRKKITYMKYVANKGYFSHVAMKTKMKNGFKDYYNNESAITTCKQLVNKFLPRPVFRASPYSIPIYNIQFLTTYYPDGFICKYYDVDEKTGDPCEFFIYGKDDTYKVSMVPMSHSAHHVYAPIAMAFLDNDVDVSYPYNKIGALMSSYGNVEVHDFINACYVFFGLRMLKAIDEYRLHIIESNKPMRILAPSDAI
jgi:hypothetical protein